MSNIGHVASLPVLRVERDRVVLDGGEDGEIALSRDELPYDAAGAVEGETLDVFVLTDHDAAPIATTRRPLVTLGHCASLPVVALSGGGAFLDWGLSKNLLLPYAEQRRPLEVGQHECVQVYLDNTGRLAASARLDHRLAGTPAGYVAWQAVDLLVCQRTDLGFKAVVDDRAIGLLYRDEIFRDDVQVGLRLPGFVKRLRADGLIDLALQPQPSDVRDALAERILIALAERGGTLELTDRSSPEAIREAFGVSKKNYKRALAALYKARRVTLEPERVVLVKA